MSQPVVSILIVTHNAEKYITATLASCLRQTYPHFELLILDNGSTDRTKTLLRQQTDSRIHVVYSDTNSGPYVGLNTLLARATGTYVAIQDHDDLWLPEKLEQQVRWLGSRPRDVACGTLTWYYFEKRRLLILPPNPLLTAFVDHTSLMFRRNRYRYDPARSLPDEFFERRTLGSAGPISCIQKGLTVHRIRHDRQNLSSRRSRWNIRGAWEHLRLTGYRDLAGASQFFLLAVLPEPLQWWIRRHLTLRRGQWLSVNQFTADYHFPLS